jgi:hypothetical protein
VRLCANIACVLLSVVMTFTPVLAGPRHTFRAAAPGLSPKVIDAANVLTLIPAFVTGIQVRATSTTTSIHPLCCNG